MTTYGKMVAHRNDGPPVTVNLDRWHLQAYASPRGHDACLEIYRRAKDRSRLIILRRRENGIDGVVVMARYARDLGEPAPEFRRKIVSEVEAGMEGIYEDKGSIWSAIAHAARHIILRDGPAEALDPAPTNPKKVRMYCRPPVVIDASRWHVLARVRTRGHDGGGEWTMTVTVRSHVDDMRTIVSASYVLRHPLRATLSRRYGWIVPRSSPANAVYHSMKIFRLWAGKKFKRTARRLENLANKEILTSVKELESTSAAQ